MATTASSSSSLTKTIELPASASSPRGATIRLSVEYRIRPSVSPHTGPIYEDVTIEKSVNVDRGLSGQHIEASTYKYANETDLSSVVTKDLVSEHFPEATIARVLPNPSMWSSTNEPFPSPDDDVLIRDTVVEHISEDEKSTSSEEVIFEEWSEEFRCRRTDEYDRRSNQLLRSSINPTSERIKGDVVKEEYKGKHQRIKGHKSYDVVRDVYRRVPAKSADPSKVVARDRMPIQHYEEISQTPLSSQLTTTSSSALPLIPTVRDRHWSVEEQYITEIVRDADLARNIQSSVRADRVETKSDSSSSNYDRIRPNTPATTGKVSSANYDRISPSIAPTFQRKHEREELISEEYQVEVEQYPPTAREHGESSSDDITNTYAAIRDSSQGFTKQTDETSSARRGFDWRNRMKQMHSSTSDDDQLDQSDQLIDVITLPPPTVDDRLQVQKRSAVTGQQTETTTGFSTSKTDRILPTGRVGELKTAFESPTNTNMKEDSSNYKTAITTGVTEQRRKLFEEQERTSINRRPITDFHSDERRMSESHTTPSRLTDRISQFESTESKSSTRIGQNDRLGRTEFDALKSAFESSMTKTPTQSSSDITFKTKQTISSIDSDLTGASPPIYQSTPKAHYQSNARHQSIDPPITTPPPHYNSRRDFSQSTEQTIESNYPIRPPSETNIISEAAINTGKSSSTSNNYLQNSPSPIKSSHDPTKSTITSDSGMFDYSTTSYQLPASSSSWRNNLSTSTVDDGTRTHDTTGYIDSVNRTNGQYSRRAATSDTSLMNIPNVNDTISRSTYKYETENVTSEPVYQHPQQPRTVRRQMTGCPPNNYENLANFRSGSQVQGKVPITTESRSRTALVMDEVETIETETRVECQVQRTNQFEESTTTPPRKILTTPSTSPPKYGTPSKRVLLNERPQYYESLQTNDSSVSESISYPSSSVRVEETWFKPIARDRRPPNATLSTFTSSPRTLQVTSLSPESQVTFGKHSPNEIIAIVRIPELSKGTGSTIRHGISEPILDINTKQEEDNAQAHLQYQRPTPASYISARNHREYQPRSRMNPYENTTHYSSPVNVPTRSSSSHSVLHDRTQQQQHPSNTRTVSPSQNRQRTGSLGNLFGSNVDFEIEIEKRPPIQPEQPTVVSLDQPTRAVVTTSKDGRVCIQNIVARPGNIVVINSDFHASDRSLNRSSGYFSSDELRSQGLTANYSSDEQSTSAHTRRYKNNEPTVTKLPAYYRPKSSVQRPTDHLDQVNELLHRYYQPPSSSSTGTGFHEAINQIDALYNNLDIQTNDRLSSQSSTSYDFSKPTSTSNRRKQLTTNANEYSQRYTSTGFQHIPSAFETNDIQRPFSDPETVPDNHQRHWSSSSLTDLVQTAPIRPSHSLSSSGILGDYNTPGSISPNSGYGSTQDIIVQQNRLNEQSQLVHRNRALLKQRTTNTEYIQGQYSGDDDDNDSPLSDSGSLERRPPPSPRSVNYTNRYQ